MENTLSILKVQETLSGLGITNKAIADRLEITKGGYNHKLRGTVGLSEKQQVQLRGFLQNIVNEVSSLLSA